MLTKDNDSRLEVICGDDEACLEKGSRWTTVFLFSGILNAFLAANLFLILIVVCRRFKPRLWMASILCNCLCNWINFAALITALVFRFSEIGTFCARQTNPTYFIASTESESATGQLTSAWTYERDGLLILLATSIQLVLCPCYCLLGLCTVNLIPAYIV